VDRKVGALVAWLVRYLVVEKKSMEGENEWICVNNSVLYLFVYAGYSLFNGAVHEFNLC
jgi:hypothetical protein